MLSLISVAKAQKILSQNLRSQRLNLRFTQQGLSQRSGVPLPTLRLFEQKGQISLESFLKLQIILGGLENFVNATKSEEIVFKSIDEVLKSQKIKTRKRGNRQ